MLARDFMSQNVVTVTPGAGVRDAARLMIEKHLGGLPVVTAEGDLVGMLTESDMLRRVEMGTERKRTRWAAFFADPDRVAREYVKSHGLKVHEVMSRPVVAVRDDATLAEVAETLARNRIKRVPVVRDGKVVGIISRRDFVRVLGQQEPAQTTEARDDAAIQSAILDKLREQSWLDTSYVGIAVKDAVVEATGFVSSAEQRDALRVLIEETPGVKGITDNLKVGMPARGWV
jgi:CBS domain-containing protein